MVNESLKQLYVVQQYDTKLTQLRHKLAQLDKGEAEEAARERAARDRQEALDKHKALHAELTDAELELKAVEEKKAKFEKKLFEGMILNPKELDAMRKEVEVLARRRAQLDERILGLWDALEQQKKRAEETQTALEQAERAVEQRKGDYERQKAAIEQEYKHTFAQRQKAAGATDPRILKRYEYTRKRHGGIGVAPVVDKTCSACGTTVPVNTLELLRGGEMMVTCEACARLLFIE
jgi:predicted  nucleic acid-binding Zn-ribbon protein